MIDDSDEEHDEVSACLRYLVCPIHSVYVPYSVTLNDDRL